MTTNLEYYRKQAKALLKAARNGDTAATERIRRYSGETALNTAQLTIAREQGFPSWTRFKQFILESRAHQPESIAAFLSAATSDLSKAEAMLAERPELASAGFYAALVLGDHAQVSGALDTDPQLALASGGPENVPPLVYVCFSRYGSPRSSRASDIAETARVLLRHGADPNTAFNDPQWPDNPLPCLYAATGLNNNPALAAALLDAGANPNDGESLYHSTERHDHLCLRLLLDRGAHPDDVNVLNHMLDREDAAGLRLLLEAGADPRRRNGRGQTPLHWAVWRRRSPRIVAMLLDHGAEIDAANSDGRTAYALAIESGQTATAALLTERGAATDLPPLDRYLAACAAASGDELEQLLRNPPTLELIEAEHHLLPDLAMSRGTTAVRALLAVGVPVDSRGENGGTALHWACWKGYADTVSVLLRYGASLTIEDTAFHATPAGWFAHGIHNSHERDADYPGVARELIAARAVIPAADLPTGNAEVNRLLRAAGYELV